MPFLQILGRLALAALFSVISSFLSPRPKNQSPKPGTLEDFSIQNPDEGAVVIKIYGSAWVSPQVHGFGDLYVEPIRKKGGKK
ncbi:hypothetical protein [Ruegeria sp. Ofav3-42]|uniref:hypothetical protein n=1 Tax=Ruegeria sp. Ofav3-42 TaxID=2917759 RepID=UPI001EF63CD6|nr:hypothetical protein [Ruegeria sp. Ofav3-42]MCG7520844.1 hypothetical protein [Ruegeria sp. Ofav3-42]